MRPADATADTLTAALYDRYRGHVDRLCTRRLGADEASDAAQDTFLRAWLALRGGAEIRHPLPWLLTIADNVCVSRFRARSARVATTELSDNASVDASASSDDLNGLAAAFRELPESQREALLRRELQGLSYDEIGAELGVSRASVAALIHRARRAVAESLRGARRGLPVFVPLPWVFRVGQIGHATGVGAAAGSTAAVTVAVVQLAGPPPLVVPDASAQAPRIEVSIAQRATWQTSRRIGSGSARRVGARVVIPTTPAPPRAQHGPQSAAPKGDLDVATWVPRPRTDGQVPTVAPPEPPADGPAPTEPAPGSPPEDESPTPIPPTPGSPPETTPDADLPDDGAGDESDAETGEGEESASESTAAEPGDVGSHGHSDSSRGHGNDGAPGPPQHSNAGEGGGNGQPSHQGNGNPGGASPSSSGSEHGGQQGKGNDPGQLQGGDSDEGSPHSSTH